MSAGAAAARAARTTVPAGSDWWFVRAYPGAAGLLEPAVTLLVPWMHDQARAVQGDRWFFTRYVDYHGFHLRLRVRCADDGADRLSSRTAEILDLLAAAGASGVARSFLAPAALTEHRRSPSVAPCLYSPEHRKYGAFAGVELAEELFTRSTQWFAAHLLGSPSGPRRAAVAVEFARRLVSRTLPLDERTPFWDSHRRQWAWHARLALRTDAQREAARMAVGELEEVGLPPALAAAVAEYVEGVAGTLDAAELLKVPVPRKDLLLHYLHMDLNRWGIAPAEEYLVGRLAARPAGQEIR